MSTKHFSIHQGVFIFIRFDVNNRRSFCFGSFLFQIINDLPNHGNTFFFAVKTAFFHIFQIVTENFYQLCLFDVQYKNFAGIVSEENGTHRIRSMHIHLPEPVCAVQ